MIAAARLVAAVCLLWSLNARAARPVLVTVDDLPIQGPVPAGASRADVNRALLAVLAKHRVPAVGLVVWGRVGGPSDERILRDWLAAGHELGSHSFGHLDLSKTAMDVYLADLEKARVGLRGLLEARPLRWFRFPFLDEGETLSKLRAGRAWLARAGMRNLPVTIDTQDWMFAEPFARGEAVGERYQRSLRTAVEHYERMGDRLLSRKETPQILLVHANAVGAAEWDSLFSWMEAGGRRFVFADEVMADPAFAEPAPELVFSHGTSLWERLGWTRRWDALQAEIRGLLETQSAAWTRGDVDTFCSVYADDALFISPSGETRGRLAVLERYRKKYPGKAEMGTLSLDVIEMRPGWGTEVTPLGDSVPSRVHSVSVAARWKLVRTGKPDASGLTLIVFTRDAGGAWKIVQDASM